MKTGAKVIVRALALALLVGGVVLPAADALARAGGASGGSHSSSGYSSTRSSTSSSSHSRRRAGAASDSDDSVIKMAIAGAFGVVAIFGPLVGFEAWSRRRRERRQALENTELHSRIARADDAWRPEAMRKRVEETFYKVQQAWTERDQEIARAWMSDALYAQHKQQTDEMRREGRRNVLDQVTFLGCEIVHIADRIGKRDDEFWAVVSGRMIDYEVANYDSLVRTSAGMGPEAQEAARELQQAADGQQAAAFEELWKFTRADHGWVLNRIEPDVQFVLVDAQMFSEEVTAPVSPQQSNTDQQMALRSR